MLTQPVHLLKKYKKLAQPARVLALCYGLWTMDCGLHSADQEKQLLQSTLKQVEFIANNTKTLNDFGKETLSQAQVFLDLKSSGVPLLLQTLKSKEKNWKVRYWAVDMLGYVGEASAEKELLTLVGDEFQARLIRLRALDSILEIEKRKVGIGKKELRKKLKKLERRVKTKKIKRKIRWVSSKL